MRLKNQSESEGATIVMEACTALFERGITLAYGT